MMPYFLSQEKVMTPFLNSVRGHFQTGGSLGVVLVSIVGVTFVVGLVCWLVMVRQEKKTYGGRLNDPQKLYLDLMNALILSREQRLLLSKIAKDMRLSQPAVILLSPVKFDNTSLAWCSSHFGVSAGALGEKKLTIADIRNKLFSLR